MSYADENIIRVMNAYKSGQYKDINSGVEIKGEILEFERIELFDGKLSIMIPKDFVDMPIDIAKLKYLMEQRPQIIKMNELGDINFTFSLLDIELDETHINEVKNIFYNAIKNTQPSTIFYENKVEETDKTVIGWFDFKSHGIDVKIYNIVYCIPISGKLLHGVFNCPLSDAELWKPVAVQVMHSIRDTVNILKSQEKR